MLDKVHAIAGKRCSCGQVHSLVTTTFVNAPDATEKLIEYLKGCNETILVAADANTEKYARVITDAVGCGSVIFPAGTHATEKAAEELALELRKSGVTLAVACGSGSIHDIVRFCAYEAKIPFISYPTAASVDGFVSGIAAMTWHGQKISFPSASPVALYADENVYAYAPERLTASGAADILGKFVALTDWKAANLLTGEHLCQEIYDLEEEALLQTVKAVREREKYTAAEYAKCVMDGLILSGLAIQLEGNSRPASGAEHHLSHLWEMRLINGEPSSLHGEQVGVGLRLVVRKYKEFAEREVLLTDALLTPDKDKIMSRAKLEPVYGAMIEGILKENMPDGWESCSLSKLTADMPDCASRESKLRALIAALPSEDEVVSLLRKCGAPTMTGELSLPQDELFFEKSLTFAPYIRNRMTLLKVLQAEKDTLS